MIFGTLFWFKIFRFRVFKKVKRQKSPKGQKIMFISLRISGTVHDMTVTFNKPE